MDLPEVGVLFGIGREEVDDVVFRDTGEFEGVDIVVIVGSGLASVFGGHDGEAVLGAGGYDRGGAEGGIGGVEEHVLLGEGVLGVAGRLKVEVGEARIVLGVGLVEVVIGILAGVVAGAGADGDAGDLKGGCLLAAGGRLAHGLEAHGLAGGA